MSVYVPRSFATDDSTGVERLIDEYPFATLITQAGDEPRITHLPLLLHGGDASSSATDDRAGLRATPPVDGSMNEAISAQRHLIGHVARANPHWQHFADGPSTAIFHGPHAYVSPSWYTEPASQVPTWNYAVVHVHGTITLADERSAKLATLRSLIARFESHRAQPWQLQLEGKRLEAMLDAIVGFRFVISRVDAKFKFSQNKSADDRTHVIAGLREEDHAEAVATAAWMEKYATGG